MEISKDRIITSHTGGLPRSLDLLTILSAKDAGEPYDEKRCAEMVQQSVFDIVRKQKEVGFDVVNDGELSKANFVSYVRTRLGGLEVDPDGKWAPAVSKDSLAFPQAYEELKFMYGARTTMLGRPRLPTTVKKYCTGPIKYIGQKDLHTDIENMKAALKEAPAKDVFMTALSVTNIEGYFANKYYKTTEEYLVAIADAMREEYKAIVDAGFIVQIDDPRLITYYDRNPSLTLAENRKWIAQRVEATNYALRGIPQEKVRLHTCYSTNVAPRVSDLELKDYLDQMLQIKAGGYSIEAANPRHEHEWQLFEETKLPDGKVLIPGVISHCVFQVEHPELVAQRIVRFAKVVGRERVIASNDCGFATSAAGDDLPSDVSWAKVKSLVEGARLATKQLWGKN